MANCRIINGKDTVTRLKEAYEQLYATNEHISVTEFAHRVGISYHTLTHRYRDWAEKVRKWRDREQPKPRKHSPVTRSRDQIVEFAEAAELIAVLRKRIDLLSTQLERITKERDKWQKSAMHLRQMEETNERLRGLVVSFEQEIRRNLSPEQGRRMLHIIEKFSTLATSSEDSSSELTSKEAIQDRNRS